MKPRTEVVKAKVADTPAALMRLLDMARDAAAAKTSASLPSRVVCMVSVPDGFGPNAVLPIFKPVMVRVNAAPAGRLSPDFNRNMYCVEVIVSLSKSVLPDLAMRGAGDTMSK